MKIQAIFEGFEQHRLGEDSLPQLLSNLRAALTQVCDHPIYSVMQKVLYTAYMPE